MNRKSNYAISFYREAGKLRTAEESIMKTHLGVPRLKAVKSW
ncbi:MAG: hypothetical protein ACQESS_04605 [Bacillota bacterium]